MKQLAAFYFFLSCSGYCFSQNTDYRFDNLTEKHGLADANVASIIKDNKGYMWFASSEGLNRFDGTSCRVYRHSGADSNSLSADNINVVFEDSKKRLWIATRDGLNLYDRLNDNFKHFYHDSTNKNTISNNEIWSLAEDKKGTLWIGTMGGGLNKLIELKRGGETTTSFQFIHFTFDPGNRLSLSDNIVWSIAFDNHGQGWVGTNNGLNRFLAEDATDNQVSFTRCFRTSEKNSLADNTVWKVWVDNNNLVWLLSFTKMLDCVRADAPANVISTSFIHIWQPLVKTLNVNDLGALSIITDKPGSYWIGTDKYGLMHCTINIQQQTGKVFLSLAEHFIHNEQNAQSLVNDLIYGLYEDETGLIWIGTENGISRFTPQKGLFDAAHLNSTELVNTAVKVSYADDRYAWFARANKLWIYNKKDSLTHLICNLYNLDKYVEISCLYTTTTGDLLIGTNSRGLFLLGRNEIQRFIAEKGKHSILPLKFILKGQYDYDYTSIFFITGAGRQVFIGGSGVIGLLDPETHLFRDFLLKQQTNPLVIFRCIAAAGQKYYVGSDNGLFEVDIDKLQYVPFQSLNGRLSSGRINSLLFTDNKLWIATVSGLNVYDTRNGSLKNYFISDGLPDDNITSLGHDKEGNTWIGTPKGLSRFNSNNATFSNFYENDGLNSNQLNALSFDGYFLFAATDKGINTLTPPSLKKTTGERNIVISDFKIAGRSLFAYPLSGNGRALKQQQRVKVNWSENNISVKFNALEYVNPAVVKYAFMLEGFDKKWTYNDNNTMADYTNLPGGSYIFKIKYAGSDGQWHESNTTIFIDVSTAWFRAWWFYAMCSMGAMGLCYAYYRMRINRILALQRIRNKIARDLHDDIGSTLSTIKILSGAAEKKVVSDALQSGKMLHKITESADKMMDAMSDIVWSINPNNDRVENMAVRMREYAAKALEPKNINYKIIADDKSINTKLPVEKRKDIFLIFKEAVNNLAKYAGATEAEITIHVQNDLVKLVIKDNGKGFDVSKANTGNGLKNMRERAKNIGGDIGIMSEEGNGATIHLTIPIT